MQSKLISTISVAALLGTCASATAEVTQEQLDAITTPDTVETSIGTLRFIDGAPLPETSETIYDYLDTMRGVDTFLKGIPAASIYAIIEGTYSLGAEEAHQVVIFDDLATPAQLGLTYNSTTMYIFPTLDLERDGPTVVEVPAGALGALNDAYFRYVTDVGPAGPDGGEGGRYLILPPGYEGDIPEGYLVVDNAQTYRHWLLIRYSVADGVEEASEYIRANLKIYPLSEADNPPEMEFINGSAEEWNSVHANNFLFYEELNAVVQQEPIDFLDPETRGLFASIGIAKGQPFEPDERMRAILEDAVAIGNAAARSIVWHPRTNWNMAGLQTFEGLNWNTGFLNANVFFNGEDGQTMNTDARVTFHYPYTVVTPAMAQPQAGTGSDYRIAYLDADDEPFDGSQVYRVTLPPNPPADDFWAFTLYDAQTRSHVANRPAVAVDR
ncbi:MAG: DUF1254 domain-containing protein [Synechococcus sp.]